jgi:hypothetical protein
VAEPSALRAGRAASSLRTTAEQAAGLLGDIVIVHE